MSDKAAHVNRPSRLSLRGAGVFTLAAFIKRQIMVPCAMLPRVKHGPALCIMVAPFPPPVYGSAVVTAAVRDAMILGGYRVKEINSSGARLEGDNLISRMLRRLMVALSLGRALVSSFMEGAGPCTTVYICCAGGGGQIGDLLAVLIARAFRRPIIMHHHSFAYIREKLSLTDWLFTTAGHKTRHVFLCQTMRRQAMTHYAAVQRGYVISNAALVALPDASPSALERPLRRVGFFSNIVAEKGIDRFLDIARHFHETGVGLVFDVAGPFRDDASKADVLAAAEAGVILYHGGLSGETKARFFETIDLLILPSRYIHEAEPVVVLEALAAGIPVIATERGCIADLIGETGSVILDFDATDTAPAVRLIETWLNQPQAFAMARREAVARGEKLRLEGQQSLPLLLKHAGWRPKS